MYPQSRTAPLNPSKQVPPLNEGEQKVEIAKLFFFFSGALGGHVAHVLE